MAYGMNLVTIAVVLANVPAIFGVGGPWEQIGRVASAIGLMLTGVAIVATIVGAAGALIVNRFEETVDDWRRKTQVPM